MNDKNYPLVFILTPSYNCGEIICKLLDSILEQTYPNVEMTVIDDGSTDNTKDVILDYVPKFAAKGYKLNYVYQENGGQSGAINNGLKLVHGDYLSWPDADDWYATPDAIEKSVTALENAGDEYSILRVGQQEIDENGNVTLTRKPDSSQHDLFSDCIIGSNGFYYNPGGYMVRTKFLDELIPNREIYTSKKAGQNWQLMLPYLYNRRCLSIGDILFSVLVRNASHHRVTGSSYVATWKQQNIYKQTLYSTLDRMPYLQSANKYKLMVWKKYMRIYATLAYGWLITRVRK